MLDALFVLAQAVPDVTDGMPPWMKYVLGPLGALVLMGIYAYHTEKHRMPKLSGMLIAAQAEAKKIDTDCDDAKAKMRKAYEAREEKLRKQVDQWKSRHSRENTRRIFWQTTAIDIARRAKEPEPKMPTELTRTNYSVPPIPVDPEPEKFDDDDSLPPAP
jgi:hypothetical protein